MVEARPAGGFGVKGRIGVEVTADHRNAQALDELEGGLLPSQYAVPPTSAAASLPVLQSPPTDLHENGPRDRAVPATILSLVSHRWS